MIDGSSRIVLSWLARETSSFSINWHLVNCSTRIRSSRREVRHAILPLLSSSYAEPLHVSFRPSPELLQRQGSPRRTTQRSCATAAGQNRTRVKPAPLHWHTLCPNSVD